MAQDPRLQGRALAGPAGEADIPPGGACCIPSISPAAINFGSPPPGSTIASENVSRAKLVSPKSRGRDFHIQRDRFRSRSNGWETTALS